MRVTVNDRPRVRARVFTRTGELRDVIVADDQLGYAICYRRDSRGRLVLTPDRKGLETVEIHGEIFIERQRPPFKKRR